MSARQPIGSIGFLLLVLLLSVSLRDAAGAQERWPPWQSYGEAEDAARKRAKRKAMAAESLEKLDRSVEALKTAGKYKEAIPLARRALAVAEKRSGANSPAVAKALDTLAELYVAQGQFAEAEPLLKRSLAIREKAPGQPDVAASLEKLANLYEKQGKPADAAAARARIAEARQQDEARQQAEKAAAAKAAEEKARAEAEAAQAAAKADEEKAKGEVAQGAKPAMPLPPKMSARRWAKPVPEPGSGGATPESAESAPADAAPPGVAAPPEVGDGGSSGADQDQPAASASKDGGESAAQPSAQVEPAPPPPPVAAAQDDSVARASRDKSMARKAAPKPAMVPPPLGSAAPSAPMPTIAPAAPPAPVTMAPPPPAGGAAPPAAAAAPAEQTDWDVVPVFYGTDRAVQPNAQRLAFGSDRARKLQLGEAMVTVPKVHQVPKVERPWVITIPYFDVTIYAEKEDPKQHFTIKEIKALTKEQLLALVKERLKNSQRFKDQAVVFVHGYNTSFDNALYRTAQIAYDLEFDGASFLYSWPSGGAVASYTYDRESAQAAEPYLREFLEMVVKQTGAKSVSVIAHSMGNQPLMDVLRDMKSAAPEGVTISQVILAAPDVDADSFSNLAAAIKGLAKNVTLYVASNDRALIVSRNFWGSYRAGDVPPAGPLILPGIDTIDVTAASTDAFAINHSGYAQNNKLLEDIAELMKTGLRPPELRVLKPSKVTTGSGDYWRYAAPP